MSWKEIKRIEHIFRKERGEKSIDVRLVKQNEEIISIIFEMEDKNSKNSMKLSIEEWDNLLVFFNSVDNIIKTPSILLKEENKNLVISELEEITPTEVIIEEPSETIPEAKVIGSAFEEPSEAVPETELISSELEEFSASIPEAKVIGSAFEEPSSTVTLIHKDMTSIFEPTTETPVTELEEEIPAPVLVIEQEEPPAEVETKPFEFIKPPPPPKVTIEEMEQQNEITAQPIELEKKPSPPAILLEQIEPTLEVKPEISEPEIESPIPSPVSISEIDEVKTEEIDLFPEMPPEVKEIFEELDNQAIELEKSLIGSEVFSSDLEVSKEIKITKAMQEVAELMPTGPARDFVEQMIEKRKESQKNDEEISDSTEEEESSKEKETKNNIKEEEKLKYW